MATSTVFYYGQTDYIEQLNLMYDLFLSGSGNALLRSGAATYRTMLDQILGAAGTAAAPGYAFAGEADTGLIIH